MGFQEAVKTFYSRYTDFKGRSRRAEYWWVQLYLLLVGGALGLIIGLSGGFSQTSEMGFIALAAIILLALFFLLNFIGLIALQVRRFHDLGQTGWLVLVFTIAGLIPLIGTLTAIGQLIWFCLRGTVGPNKYGMDPLGGGDASVFD